LQRRSRRPARADERRRDDRFDLDRLGIPGRTYDEVRWSSILGIERDKIIVDDP
jgi:hypothetical protein